MSSSSALRGLASSARAAQAAIPKSPVAKFVNSVGAGSAASSSRSPQALAGALLDEPVAAALPRYDFQPGEKIRPYDFAHPVSATAPARPPARPPLLGPPARVAKQIDPFLLSSTSPLLHASNPTFAHAFTNALGKIKPRAQTGLGWASQRRVGKMVRRARAMGVVNRWTNVPRRGALGWSDEGYLRR